MYCIFCGTKNPDKAKFCVACGQNLAKALQETKPPVKPAASESTVLGITKEEVKNQTMSAQIQGFFNGNPAVKSLPKTTTGTGRGDALSRWETVKARKDMPNIQTTDQNAADKNIAAPQPESAPAPVPEEKTPASPAPASEPDPENKERPAIEVAIEAPSPLDRGLSQPDAPVAAPTEGTPQKGPAPAAPVAVDAPAAVSTDKRQPTEPTDGLVRQGPGTAGPDLEMEKSEADGVKNAEIPDSAGDRENRKSEGATILHDAEAKAETVSTMPENLPARSTSAEMKKRDLPAKAKNLFKQLKSARSERKAAIDTQKQKPAEVDEADLDANYETDFADVPTGRVKMVKRSKESVREIRRNILILIAISIPLIVGSIFLIMK